MTSATSTNVSLVGGALMTGLAGAAFLVVTERHLGVTEFEPIAHLWTIWSVSAAAITFSVQQWVAVAADARVDRRILSSVLAGSVVVFLIAWVFRDDLFAGNRLFWPVVALALPLGTLGVGIARGLWAREARFGGVALVLVGENGIRIAGALVLVGFTNDARLFGLTLILGFAVAALRPRRRHEPVERKSTGHSVLGATAAVGFAGHLAVVGGPLFIAINGATSQEVTTFFAILTVARIPLLAVQGLVPRAVVKFDQLIRAGEWSTVSRYRQTIFLAGLGTAALGAAVAFLLGPWVIELLFDLEAQPADVALAAASLVLASASLIANSGLVAERRVVVQLVAWLVPISLGFLWIFLVQTSTTRALLGTLLVIEWAVLVAVTLLPVAHRYRQSRTGLSQHPA